MYGSELEHVMMHLWRMSRDVKGALFLTDNPKADEARLIFLTALGEAQDAVVKFYRIAGDLSTTDDLT